MVAGVCVREYDSECLCAGWFVKVGVSVPVHAHVSVYVDVIVNGVCVWYECMYMCA